MQISRPGSRIAKLTSEQELESEESTACAVASQSIRYKGADEGDKSVRCHQCAEEHNDLIQEIDAIVGQSNHVEAVHGVAEERCKRRLGQRDA